MKLRIRGNTLRLRLTQSEVKEIGDGKLVQESIEFAKGARLHYVLEPTGIVSTIEARFVDHRISVLVPIAMAKDWASSQKVEMKSAQPLESDKEAGLAILIEKDFVCLKPRQHESEDEGDMFPNPNEAHGSCGGAHV